MAERRSSRCAKRVIKSSLPFAGRLATQGGPSKVNTHTHEVTRMNSIEALESYAMAHYETGGHWVIETFSRSEYQEALDAAGGCVETAKEALRKWWTAYESIACDIQNS